MSILSTILIFVAVLAVLVLVHEFGHFIIAKRSGIRVDEFGFGFPPRIFGKRWRGTLYTLNWIPLGGFVKIKGVAGDDPKAGKSSAPSTNKDSFTDTSHTRRFLILFAGIGMNLLLAVVLFTITHALGATTDISRAKDGADISDRRVLVSSVLEQSPAQNAGLQPGDIIVSVNNQPTESATAISDHTQAEGGTDLDVQVQSGEEIRSLTIPTAQIPTGDGGTYIGIGIALQEIATVRYPIYVAPWRGIQSTVEVTKEIFISLGRLVQSLAQTGKTGEDLAGPVGIAVITGQVASLGMVELLQFVSVLSINLAIFNFLPIPALDGGRIVFLILEAVRRKPVSPQLEAVVHNIGFLALLAVAILVTIKDVARFDLLSFLSI